MRFHHALYAGQALDEAVRLYSPHAKIERADAAPYWTVNVTADSPARERRVAGELANYALGLTVKERSGSGGASGAGHAGQVGQVGQVDQVGQVGGASSDERRA